MKQTYLEKAEAAHAALVAEYKALDERRNPMDGKLPRSQALMDASQLADRAKSASDAGVQDADVTALAALIAPTPAAKPAKKK